MWLGVIVGLRGLGAYTGVYGNAHDDAYLGALRRKAGGIGRNAHDAAYLLVDKCNLSLYHGIERLEHQMEPKDEVFLGFDTFVCRDCAGATLLASIKANPTAHTFVGLRGESFERMNDWMRQLARKEFDPLIPKCECGKVTV